MLPPACYDCTAKFRGCALTLLTCPPKANEPCDPLPRPRISLLRHRSRMPPEEYRELEPSREAKEVFERWISYLDREIEKHQKPALREELVQDNLHQLMLGAPKGGRLNFQLESELAFNVLQLSFQSRNITLEAEYDPAI